MMNEDLPINKSRSSKSRISFNPLLSPKAAYETKGRGHTWHHTSRETSLLIMGPTRGGETITLLCCEEQKALQATKEIQGRVATHVATYQARVGAVTLLLKPLKRE